MIEPATPDLTRRPDEELGPWVARARDARGWSVARLAELAQVPEAQIERVEAGAPLRQQSSRARLRLALETGEAYVPAETAPEAPPATEELGSAPVPSAVPAALSPLERLRAHVDLLGAPLEGASLAAQAAAFGRWAADQGRLDGVRVVSLLPGLGAAPDPPSLAARTVRTRTALQEHTTDTWDAVGRLTLAEVRELPGGDRRMARELVEAGASVWATLGA